MHMGRVGGEVGGEASGSVDRWGGRWVVRAGGRTGWRESGGARERACRRLGAQPGGVRSGGWAPSREGPEIEPWKVEKINIY